MTAYDSYQEIEILSADPVKLIELLYRGALDSVRFARLHLRAGEIEERGRAVSKTAAILLELAASLDHQRGGDVSRNLSALYEYMQHRISEAHLNQIEGPLAEVEKLLSELLDGWVSCSIRQPEMPAGFGISQDSMEAESVSCLC